jgi:hypothetical protein
VRKPLARLGLSESANRQTPFRDRLDRIPTASRRQKARLKATAASSEIGACMAHHRWQPTHHQGGRDPGATLLVECLPRDPAQHFAAPGFYLEKPEHRPSRSRRSKPSLHLTGGPLMRTQLKVLAAIAMVIFSTPLYAASSERFLDQVRAQLLVAAIAFTDKGYELTSAPYTGSLRQGQVDDLKVDLNAGQNYLFIGLCDQDCGDIDLYLYDENGQLIDSDIKNDDKPLVLVTPRWSGRFYIKVKMVSCSNQPCFYGVGNFRK